MYVIMDSKALKHSWNYNLCFLLFLMVTSTSPFMMISLWPLLKITIDGTFLLKWLLFYNTSLVISIIIFTTFTRVVARSLKYSVLAMSGLLMFHPVILSFCCEAYLKCSLYTMSVLCGFVQGLIYLGMIQFMNNSKFTGKYTWPALMYVDIPSTLFYMLTVSSERVTVIGFIVTIWYSYLIMGMIGIGIFYVIVRIERYERCLTVSLCEKKIMEEIVVERRLSNCSTSIDSNINNDGVYERIKHSFESLKQGFRPVMLIFISTISFSLPMPFIMADSENEDVIANYILLCGIVRIMCLSIPVLSKKIAFGNITASVVSICSFIYVTMPLLLTFINGNYGILMKIFLGLSAIVQSLIICGVLSNWFNSLPENTKDKRKNSFLVMVVLSSAIAYAMGVAMGSLLCRLSS